MIKYETKLYHDEYGRVCSKCREYKDWEEYYYIDPSRNLRASACKACKKIYFNESYKKKKLSYLNNDKSLEDLSYERRTKPRKDDCPELTPEMFGIIIEEDDD